MPATNPDSSAEDLAQVLAAHAALLWGQQKAADMGQSLTQAARMLLDIGQHPPAPDTEPACYPAAE